jgi:hypothetical protein
VIVTCRNCKATFTRGVDAPTQAIGCSCNVFNGKIHGHYGSRHDISEYRFIRDPLPNMDPICDGCIDKMLAEGQIEYEGEWKDFDQEPM